MDSPPLGRSCSVVFVAVLTLLLAPPASSQQPASPAGADANERLLQKIADLEERVRQLERSQAGKERAPAEAPPAPVAAEIKPVEMEHSNMNAPGLPGMQIRGFADAAFRATDAKGRTQSFGLGQFDLYITSRLSDNVRMLAEIVLESGEDNAIGIDLERVLLQYAPNDYFNIGIGRYHTAIGYYNTAYHHGTWFQAATGRPFLFAFEDNGGILPMHNVGLTAGGRIPSGPLGLHYVAEVGNGRTSRSSTAERVQNAVDENNGKAVNFGIIAQPKRWSGFQAGFSVYRDRLTPDDMPKVGQFIFAGHAVYMNPRFEFLNEAMLIRHALPNGEEVFRTPAFYTQISRRFGVVRPYFRYEYMNASARDPIHGDVGRRNGPSAGIRYDFNEFATFKLQYDRAARRSMPAANGMTMQVAFAF